MPPCPHPSVYGVQPPAPSEVKCFCTAQDGANGRRICINSGRYNTSTAKHNIRQAVSPLSLVLPDGAPRTDQRAGPQLCSQHGSPVWAVGQICPLLEAAEPCCGPAPRAEHLFPLPSEKVKRKEKEIGAFCMAPGGCTGEGIPGTTPPAPLLPSEPGQEWSLWALGALR